MRQNLTGQGHRRRHVQQPLILRFRYPVLIFGPFTRGLKMSAALEAGFLCSRPRSTQLHFGRRGRAKRTETCIETQDGAQLPSLTSRLNCKERWLAGVLAQNQSSVAYSIAAFTFSHQMV